MSYYSALVNATSTAFSGAATPDVQIPFEPQMVKLSLNGAGPVAVSLDGKNDACVLYPSPHPAAHLEIRSNQKQVWVRNLVSSSTAQVNVFADDAGY